MLATVLFTDLVDSTATALAAGSAWPELLAEHNAVIRRELARFRGETIDTAGDGFFASGFDGPARAIRCACAIRDAVGSLGLGIRVGVHTGECDVVDDKLAGLAVAVGARVAAKADVGEVLVSGTVKDLVAGSGISFDARGNNELKGLGEWPLYAVARPRLGRVFLELGKLVGDLEPWRLRADEDVRRRPDARYVDQGTHPDVHVGAAANDGEQKRSARRTTRVVEGLDLRR